ncbi:MAG: hypothetical protein K9J12_10195 [Melioribacteraceae bacterium]|nr:hypothetical protein [Melioribacteraceae bacterium]MCF8265457.1 hypothetical protein [Melioribacteraceae bacterium]
MTKIQAAQKVELNGKVIEIYQRESEKLMTIQLEPSFLSFRCILEENFHLGDEILIKGNLTIENLSEKISDDLNNKQSQN